MQRYTTSRVVPSLLVFLLCMWPELALTLGEWLLPVFLRLEIALVTIGGACLGLLVHALVAAFRSLGEKSSAWASKAVGAHMAS